MKVTFTRNTSVKGQSYAAGETADLDPQDAALIVTLRKAILAEGIQTREPAVEHRDPEVQAMTTKSHGGAKPKKSRT